MWHVAIYFRRWMLRLWAMALLMALFLSLTVPAAIHAETSTAAENMTLLGLYGGAMNAIAIDGQMSYIGQGAVVATVSLASPTQPQRIGQSALLPAVVTAVAVDQGYVYAGLGDAGVAVLDVSDPASPTVVAQVATPGRALDVGIVGEHLIVASDDAGLQMLEISNPAQPTVVGSLDTPGSAQRFVVSGNTLYLADGSGGLRIIDVTTPATPAETGTYDTSGDVVGVAYHNNHAYVAESPGDLHAIDVSDPAQPNVVKMVEVLYTLDDLVMGANHLYVLMNGDLFIYDRDPQALTELTFDASPFSATGVVEAGDYAYATDTLAGLYVFDIHPPAQMAEVGLLRTLSRAQSVALHGYVAYASQDFHGIAALDISQSTKITETARFGILPRVDQQVVVAGNVLIQSAYYIVPGGENRRLYFHTLADPNAPQPIGDRGIAELFSVSPHVAVRVNVIFAANGSDGVALLDPDDPTGTPLGVFTPAGGYVYSVAASASHNLLFAVSSGRIRIVDVSTPADPQQIGEVVGSYGATAGSGNLLFTYNGSTQQLDIIDITNPASPQTVGSVALPGNDVGEVVVAGNLVLVANGSGGVRVIDVSTPTAPAEIASFVPGDEVMGLALSGNLVYVAANDLGLMVVRLGSPTALDRNDQPQEWRLLLPVLEAGESAP